MRQGKPDVSRMAFFAFDLTFENGVDLRGLPLSERQRDLARFCHKATRSCRAYSCRTVFPSARRIWNGAPTIAWKASSARNCPRPTRAALARAGSRGSARAGGKLTGIDTKGLKAHASRTRRAA